ncbi:unnamed protein product [Amoebophrya sp. A25]|nr:unnamed protein product [Amoebophrya sp. A25]|eukprot:GSA25T00026789001.1
MISQAESSLLSSEEDGVLDNHLDHGASDSDARLLSGSEGDQGASSSDGLSSSTGLKSAKKQQSKSTGDDPIEVAFSTYDTSGDGFLSLGELHSALVSIMGADVVTEDLVREVLAEVDGDGDGQVNLEEFYL